MSPGERASPVSSRRKRWIVLAGALSAIAIGALAAVLVLGGSGADETRAPESPAAPLRLDRPARLGMNASEIADVEFSVSGPVDEAHLAAISLIGATEARLPAVWAAADPTGTAAATGAWAWNPSFDFLVAALAQNGLRWYPFLGYPPAVLSAAPDHLLGGNPTGEAVRSELPAFVSALIARYGRGGEFWAQRPNLPYLPVTHLQAWNEPNLRAGSWEPNTEDADQAEQAMDLYESVRSAGRELDPELTVVFPSLSPLARNEELGEWSDPVEFLRRVRAYSSAPIDAVGYHPYGSYIATEGPFGSVALHLRRLRAEMERIGLGDTPIEITELGFASDPQGFLYSPDREVKLSEEQRARAYREAITKLRFSDCGVSAIFPYAWFSPRPTSYAQAISEGTPAALAYYVGEVFAIANPDATLKPSGEAVTAAFARPPKPTKVCG